MERCGTTRRPTFRKRNGVNKQIQTKAGHNCNTLGMLVSASALRPNKESCLPGRLEAMAALASFDLPVRLPNVSLSNHSSAR